MTSTRPTADDLVQPRLDRQVAMHLAATEYDRMADALTALSVDDWSKATDCPAWNVRELGCHMVGMAEMATDPQEGERQRTIAGSMIAAEGGEFVDALTAVQVSERADWGPEQVVAGARSVGPRAAVGRERTPLAARQQPLQAAQLVNGVREIWSVGFLVDVILTRDPWMHRMDLARATGRDPALTADHDGVIVADVVEEWSARHDAPYELELTGPAGGSWRRGRGGERIEIDAIDFCRILSGRGQAQGLLSVAVPF
jgi:uncharacterized protein (TIGR03083 family)